MSSEGFAYTERFLPATSQEEQGVEDNSTHLPGGSPARNLFKPPHVVSI